jgi:nitroreductase
MTPQIECHMYEILPEMIAAIQTRRSCRHFLHTQLTTEDDRLIYEFLSEFTSPFEHHVSITYHRVPETTNIVYFQGPGQFIALSADRSVLEQAKLGFLGEQLVLFSEAIGLRTCWMGHYRTQEVNEIVYSSSKPDKENPLYCIILLGHIPERTGLLDRISQRRFSKKTRMVDSFLSPDSLTEFPNYIRDALELTSKAPSAMNSQKWYYMVQRDDEGYIIELGKRRGYQHFKWKHYDIDVGTAAAHLWLGLVYVGVHTDVSVRDEAGDAVWRFRLKG